MSGQWAEYSTIKDVPEGYQHGTVDHSLHFIDPETSAYTNSIESLWRKFKESHKSRGGAERALLDLHMDEFVWKKNVWGHCDVPPLVPNSGTLSFPLRFRLKVRAYSSAPDRTAF